MGVGVPAERPATHTQQKLTQVPPPLPPLGVHDFQPRANIQAQFAAGQLKCPASIRAFASELSVDESLG